MRKKNMENIIQRQNIKIKLLRQELKVKNNMLLKVKHELEKLKICKEECSLKLQEIKEEISRQNYNSSKNLENKINSILENKKYFSK